MPSPPQGLNVRFLGKTRKVLLRQSKIYYGGTVFSYQDVQRIRIDTEEMGIESSVMVGAQD